MAADEGATRGLRPRGDRDPAGQPQQVRDRPRHRPGASSTGGSSRPPCTRPTTASSPTPWARTATRSTRWCCSRTRCTPACGSRPGPSAMHVDAGRGRARRQDPLRPAARAPVGRTSRPRRPRPSSCSRRSRTSSTCTRSSSPARRPPRRLRGARGGLERDPGVEAPLQPATDVDAAPAADARRQPAPPHRAGPLAQRGQHDGGRGGARRRRAGRRSARAPAPAPAPPPPAARRRSRSRSGSSRLVRFTSPSATHHAHSSITARASWSPSAGGRPARARPAPPRRRRRPGRRRGQAAAGRRLAGQAGQAGARRVALPAAPPAAHARRAVRVHHHVPGLAGEAVGAPHQPAAGHHAAADAGAEGDQHHVGVRRRRRPTCHSARVAQVASLSTCTGTPSRAASGSAMASPTRPTRLGAARQTPSVDTSPAAPTPKRSRGPRARASSSSTSSRAVGPRDGVGRRSSREHGAGRRRRRRRGTSCRRCRPRRDSTSVSQRGHRCARARRGRRCRRTIDDPAVLGQRLLHGVLDDVVDVHHLARRTPGSAGPRSRGRRSRAAPALGACSPCDTNSRSTRPVADGGQRVGRGRPPPAPVVPAASRRRPTSSASLRRSIAGLGVGSRPDLSSVGADGHRDVAVEALAQVRVQGRFSSCSISGVGAPMSRRSNPVRWYTAKASCGGAAHVLVGLLRPLAGVAGLRPDRRGRRRRGARADRTASVCSTSSPSSNTNIRARWRSVSSTPKRSTAHRRRSSWRTHGVSCTTSWLVTDIGSSCTSQKPWAAAREHGQAPAARARFEPAGRGAPCAARPATTDGWAWPFSPAWPDAARRRARAARPGAMGDRRPSTSR